MFGKAELELIRLKKFMKTPKQFNNITERVIDDLRQTLSEHSQISIAAARILYKKGMLD